MIERRGFITGLVSLVAAPAIVRAGSLMPVRVMLPRIEIIHYRHLDVSVRMGWLDENPSPEARRVFSVIHRGMADRRSPGAKIIASDARTVTVQYDA